jgi:CDP-diacylglycerol--serine O-phosphatidyltransferase
LQPANKIAWTATLFFCVCAVLRLARFNSELQEETDKSKMFFTGIPMPAAGFLVLLPLVMYLEFGHDFFRDWRLIASWMILVGLGSISIIPTFAGKKFIMPRRFVVPLLSSFAIIAAGVFIKPWIVWICFSIIYIVHIPLAALAYNKMKGNFV